MSSKARCSSDTYFAAPVPTRLVTLNRNSSLFTEYATWRRKEGHQHSNGIKMKDQLCSRQCHRPRLHPSPNSRSAPTTSWTWKLPSTWMCRTKGPGTTQEPYRQVSASCGGRANDGRRLALGWPAACWRHVQPLQPSTGRDDSPPAQHVNSMVNVTLHTDAWLNTALTVAWLPHIARTNSADWDDTLRMHAVRPCKKARV
jgi:hypothetical protein